MGELGIENCERVDNVQKVKIPENEKIINIFSNGVSWTSWFYSG
jgi:hypothetical protein